MSKYNLIDIFEDYKIGSGWTNDFDYDGMLNAGLALNAETDIETLKKVVEDFTDVNYHREASHLYDVIEAIEGGDVFEANGKIDDFHAEIRKTMQDQGMDTSDDLGAYMASKMEEGEAVDLAIEASQKKAGIEEKEEKKLPMDETKEPVKEEEGFVEVHKDEIKMHLDQYRSGNIDGDDLAQAIEEIVFGRNSMEESFDSLAKKVDKQKGVDKDYAGKIAGKIANIKRKGGGSGPTAKQKKRMSEGVVKNIMQALRDDAKATDAEIKQYMSSLMKAGDKFDDIDDYVEDFKEYVSNKSLQETQYAPEVVDRIEMVRKALYDTNNFDAKEIEAYIKSIVGDFERGDFEAYDDFKADDYVEDIKNYISDKALQEHFKRFR